MTLQELRDKIKKEDYIWVQFDDDEAEGIYRATGELVITIDK